MTDRLDIVGIGSAIVDVIASADEARLAALGLTKGTMRLIDAVEAEQLYAGMGPAVETSGGSVANTCAGVASLGGRAGFVGRVADDQLGAIFAHDMRAGGVAYTTPPVEGGQPTARCLVLVTADGERTMSTFLGAAAELSPSDLDADVIRGSRALYLEGYAFDHACARAACFDAAGLARAAGVPVALTLSDPFCVERHRAAFLDALPLIAASRGLVFANEHEAMALYQTRQLDEACRQLARAVPLAAVTRGAAGSIILSDGESLAVAAVPTRAVDTTGAGDLYAAGFLFGRARGLPLAACGQIASIAAAEAVSHVGPRPQRGLAALLAEHGIAA